MPYTVFMDPQLGRIGLTEREARKAGRPYRVATHADELMWPGRWRWTRRAG